LEGLEGFTEFAAASAPRLRRTAYLLCGDWHAAQDLTQSTLVQVFVAWRRIRSRGSAAAYAQRTLVNSYLAGRRRRSGSELVTAEPPESPTGPGVTDLRIVLMEALGTLAPRARAIVILRYWEDHSVDQVAAMLGCSAGNVKSQSARSLEKLRSHLGESWLELCSAD
jgi:RNA polymerase sigma-70 factor (sigma-E family)